LTSGRTHQQQIPHIRACDQQNKRDRHEQSDQCRSKPADGVFRQSRQSNAVPGVVSRMFLLDLAGDDVHIRLRLVERDTGLETCDGPQMAR